MFEILNEVIFYIHYATSITGIIINLYLLYLIIKHTPEVLKTYSVLVFHACIIDTVACIASVLTITRIIPTGTALTYVFHGLCTFISADFCYYSYICLLHTYAHSLFIVLASFVFRFIVITKPHIRFGFISVCAAVIYLPSFIQFVILCFDKGDTEIMRKLMSLEHPAYNITGLVLSGNENIFSPICFGAILYMTAPVLPIYITIYILRVNIYKKLSEKSSYFSPTTIKTHQQLAKALSIHACLPVLFIFTVLCYLCMQFKIYQNPFLETLTFLWIGLIPFIAPIVSIYFIRPYREVLLKGVGTIFSKNNFQRTAKLLGFQINTGTPHGTHISKASIPLH